MAPFSPRLEAEGATTVAGDVIAPGHRTAVSVVGSVDEMLAGAARREAMKTADSLSGATFERMVLAGRPMVVKHLRRDDDWLMRATGDMGARQMALWATPLHTAIPELIDHTVVAICPLGDTARAGLALLMDDVGDRFVKSGDAALDDEMHLRFVDHMAALHGAFWGWHDPDGALMPLPSHYTALTPVTTAIEAERRGTDPVPPLVGEGWARLRSAAPTVAGDIEALLADPGPLLAALQDTPSTLVQGDWKLGNLGVHEDGRTILVDWDRCGEGPACLDLAWYLAVNCDRIRMPKEALVEAHRAALRRRGVDTDGWYDHQLGAALLGAFLQLGWAKSGGDRAELGWWVERVADAVGTLP